MLEDAIQYPRRHDDALQVILIGGLLTILSFLIIPGLIVGGYLVRVYRRVMADETDDAPGFGDWEELLGDGLRGLVILFAYLLIPMLLLVVTVGTAIVAVAVSTATGGNISPGASVALGGMAAVGALVALALLLVAWFVLPAAVANFVRNDRLTAAFALGEVVGIATSSDYVVAWLLALVVSILGSVLTGILNATVVGAVVSPFVGFYVGVAMAYLYARGAADATDDDGAAGTPAGRPAA
jgi:hypothetical protein